MKNSSQKNLSIAIQFFLKRQLDFWGACLLLLFFCLPLLIIALLIKFDSRGPVFFTQCRVGRAGKSFNMVKFRSMVEDAVHLGRGIELERNDWRITRVGKWLRRFRIDELPQLWHVLLGEMSLVGPRPPLLHQVEKYTPLEKRRLEVKPGMAALAMVKGGNLLPWPERIEWDIWYIDHWSLWLDIKILFQSLSAVLSGKDELGQSGVIRDYK